MKTQEEMYQALEKAEKTIQDNRLFDTLKNASKMVAVISTMAERADEPNDLKYKHVAFDVIRTYANLLDETIDDLQAIAYAANAAVSFGLMEPEAEEGGILMTIDQAHLIATSGDKIFHVEGHVRGEWYSDHVVEYVTEHRHDKCQVTLKTDQIISVRLEEKNEQEA